ncbi:hypothetical protein Syun_022947 [Stephania yunnanensis]|uniref:Uncharacterized protein n=1 Tax=Stephania yunnanensis TaxID=152371 RepID=A0AAP0I334_9MAGN
MDRGLIVDMLQLLESKIQEARSKKDTLRASAQSAKTATKVSEMLGNVNTSSALSAFEKMEDKEKRMRAPATAALRWGVKWGDLDMWGAGAEHELLWGLSERSSMRDCTILRRVESHREALK